MPRRRRTRQCASEAEVFLIKPDLSPDYNGTLPTTHPIRVALPDECLSIAGSEQKADYSTEKYHELLPCDKTTAAYTRGPGKVHNHSRPAATRRRERFNQTAKHKATEQHHSPALDVPTRSWRLCKKLVINIKSSSFTLRLCTSPPHCRQLPLASPIIPCHGIGHTRHSESASLDSCTAGLGNGTAQHFASLGSSDDRPVCTVRSIANPNGLFVSCLQLQAQKYARKDVSCSSPVCNHHFSLRFAANDLARLYDKTIDITQSCECMVPHGLTQLS